MNRNLFFLFIGLNFCVVSQSDSVVVERFFNQNRFWGFYHDDSSILNLPNSNTKWDYFHHNGKRRFKLELNSISFLSNEKIIFEVDGRMDTAVVLINKQVLTDEIELNFVHEFRNGEKYYFDLVHFDHNILVFSFRKFRKKSFEMIPSGHVMLKKSGSI